MLFFLLTVLLLVLTIVFGILYGTERNRAHWALSTAGMTRCTTRKGSVHR